MQDSLNQPFNIQMYCEGTLICWHQFPWSPTNHSHPWVLEIVVSNITSNNQWENCILLDLNFCGLSEQRNPQKLEPHD
jgi:hypothetical protein